MVVLEDEFGDIISKARIGNGLTPKQLAEAVGISVADVDSIEAYRLKPAPDVALTLAKTLGLDGEKLLDSLNEEWSPNCIELPKNSITVEHIAVKSEKYGENSYILGCSESKLAAVVDPGGEAKAISGRLQALGFKLDRILITHAHADHVGGMKELLTDWAGVKLVNHQSERDSIMRGLSNLWEPANDGVRIDLGEIKITPIYTPGHTTGSLCYLADGVCFVGDTLFAGSIGRPESPQAYRPMLQAIGCRLLSLPEDTIILPGHGPASTVLMELEHNPFFFSKECAYQLSNTCS